MIFYMVTYLAKTYIRNNIQPNLFRIVIRTHTHTHTHTRTHAHTSRPLSILPHDNHPVIDI